MYPEASIRHDRLYAPGEEAEQAAYDLTGKERHVARRDEDALVGSGE